MVELESSSQALAASVALIAVAPKSVGAPTPHELVPTHEESCWRWWMASNIILRAMGGRLAVIQNQSRLGRPLGATPSRAHLRDSTVTDSHA